MTILDQLYLDHGRLRALLVLLERELSAFEMAGEADLKLMQDIASYYSEYFNRVHHPLEDRMVESLLRCGYSAGECEHALVDHAGLRACTGLFLGHLDRVMNGTPVTRADFIAAGQRLVQSNLDHMEHEEHTVFAAAHEYLSIEDWNELDQNPASPEDMVGETSLLQTEPVMGAQLLH